MAEFYHIPDFFDRLSDVLGQTLVDVEAAILPVGSTVPFQEWETGLLLRLTRMLCRHEIWPSCTVTVMV